MRVLPRDARALPRVPAEAVQERVDVGSRVPHAYEPLLSPERGNVLAHEGGHTGVPPVPPAVSTVAAQREVAVVVVRDAEVARQTRHLGLLQTHEPQAVSAGQPLEQVVQTPRTRTQGAQAVDVPREDGDGAARRGWGFTHPSSGF